MINTIDLFAGCGGLTVGFMNSGHYNTTACVEWDKAPCENLKNYMETHAYENAFEKVMRFDIQRTDELIYGWDDPIYGKSQGLDVLTGGNDGKIDLIIGGPPCQAYSVAGRIRDGNGMRDDYRNFLFESYLKVVRHFQPKAFLFENVPGILSARPGDGRELVVDIIHRQFSEAGYTLLPDLKNAVIDMTEYGVPQKRSRVILLGLNNNYYQSETSVLIERFYNEYLPQQKEKSKTVRDSIGDLPALYPLEQEIIFNGKKCSHSLPHVTSIENHTPRYANPREISIFRLLAQDIESGHFRYASTAALKQLYAEQTGHDSNIHKYYVLRWDEPSNTIPAHLNKDGLRHIHPDPKQARSITVREAARLQTFPDDYEFISGETLNYKMIGNAVPPRFAQKLAESLYSLLFA